MTEGDDDDAVLQATLAFVDEYDAAPLQQQRQHGDRSHHDAGVALPLKLRLSEELRAVGGVLVDEHTLRSLISDQHAPSLGARGLPLSSSPWRQGGFNEDMAATAVQNRDELKKSKKLWNPNKARDERRDEILYLRNKVSELEIQLDNVKRKRPRVESGLTEQTHSIPPPLQQGASIVEHSRQDVHPAVVEVWKAIASRQSDARTQAERENIRLKLVLEQQIKLAKSLEKLLRNKPSTKVSCIVAEMRMWSFHVALIFACVCPGCGEVHP
jgi:hypothetical protein